MSKFQIILLMVFGVFIVIAVLLFSFYRGSSSRNVTVSLWGDITLQDFNDLVSALKLQNDPEVSIKYSEKARGALTQELTEALAEGRGPDLVILSLDEFWENRNKLVPIPYEHVSERDFKAAFVEEGELFLTPEGIYALPLTVDPMVLYWNRDLVSGAGMAKPLAYWDEIYAASTKLTKKDTAGNIVQSVFALGEARNIPNHKDTLSLLMIQAGTPITSMVNGNLRSQINSKFNLPTVPAEAALDFYTQFSNPAKVFYSWNRSLVPAQTHFAAGDSAYYLGFASELRVIKAKNPTLNFGVSLVPQSRVSGKTITLAHMRGVAVVRNSRSPGAALLAARKLASSDASVALSGILILPPARRDLLGAKPADAVMSVFYDAALVSRGWIDPDNLGTAIIFRDMIESVTSGRARTSEAVNKAHRGVEELAK